MAGLQVIADNVSLQVSVAYQRLKPNDNASSVAEDGRGSSRRKSAADHRALPKTAMRHRTDIVDAQTALVQTETSYYTAVYGFLEGLARLDYALGGDQQRLLHCFQLPPAGIGPP